MANEKVHQVPATTTEQTNALVNALKLEREGYVKKDLKGRVAQVDAQLKELTKK